MVRKYDNIYLFIFIRPAIAITNYRCLSGLVPPLTPFQKARERATAEEAHVTEAEMVGMKRDQEAFVSTAWPRRAKNNSGYVVIVFNQ